MTSAHMKVPRLLSATLLLAVQWLNPLCAQVMMSHAPATHSSVGACDSPELSCANAASPALLSNGTLLLVWTAGGAVSVAKSFDWGKTFEPRVQIAEHQKFLDTGGDARAQIVADEDGHVMVAYGYFKDAHWNAKVNMAVSSDGAEHFSEVKDLIKNGQSERFPVLALQSNHRVSLAWIDKRVVAQKNKSGKVALGGSIAYTQTSDWGQTFKKEIIVNPESCECCRIGLVIDSKDQAFLAYRAIFPGGVRDHAIQSVSEKLQPSLVFRVSDDHWQTDVCPHQGPSLSVSDEEVLHVTWFTQGSNRKGLYYAHSLDGGRSFSEPLKIGNPEFNPSRGHVLSKGKAVWLVWKEFDGEKSSLNMMFSKDQGKSWSTKTELMTTLGYSDHPLLVQSGQQIFVSWLTRLDGYRLMLLDH